jgi:hypothetical protein
VVKTVNIAIGMQDIGGVDEISQKYVQTCNAVAAVGHQVLVTPEFDWGTKTVKRHQKLGRGE